MFRALPPPDAVSSTETTNTPTFTRCVLILPSPVDPSISLKRLSSTYGYVSRTFSSIYVYVCHAGLCHAGLFHLRLCLSNRSLPYTSTSLKLFSSIYIYAYVSQTGLFHTRQSLSNWSLSSTSTPMSLKLVSAIYVYVSQTGLFHTRLCMSSWSLPSTSMSLKQVSSNSVYGSRSFPIPAAARTKLNGTQPTAALR